MMKNIWGISSMKTAFWIKTILVQILHDSDV
jgi:hypothetical protein